MMSPLSTTTAISLLLVVLLTTTCSTTLAFQVANGARHYVVPSRDVMGSTSDPQRLNTPTSDSTTDLPPVLQHIADERREFQINLGKAMDTLRKDMPYILHQAPDFSIYHENISVIDPSGVQLTGVDKYKSAIAFLQTFCKFWFTLPSSTVQYRMVYDFARSSIRISWNARLCPKVFGGRAMYVDGISIYKLDAPSGKIVEHRMENLLINNVPMMPPYGILSLIMQEEFSFGKLVPQGAPGLGAVPW